MNNMISVIMSVFSEPIAWLEMSINSILEQTYQDFEFIIICDNPENIKAQETIERYAKKDKRVILIKNEENIGLTKSLNKGLLLSKGDYIARMDADDIAHPDRLSKQIDFLEKNPEISVCSSDARVIDDHSNIIEDTRVKGLLNLEKLFRCSPLIHPTVMFRRSLLKLRNPFYNEQYKVSQDYELWTFLYLNNVKFDIIPETLLDYRVSQKQISKLHKEVQTNNSSQIGHFFYLGMLTKVIPGSEQLNLEDQLKCLSNMMKDIREDSKNMFMELLFRQYYTASRRKSTFVLKYFVDPNLLILKLSFRKTVYMFFSLFLKDRYDNLFLLYA